MVAYNLLLSIFPLALLALFIAGRVLQEPDLEQSVLTDLRQLFPTATDDTLTSALDQVRESSTSFGVFALLSSIYIGSTFWGALDTAFCRIYHCRCRSWLEQKRFALVMLVVVLLFMARHGAGAHRAEPAGLRRATTSPSGCRTCPGLLYVGTLVAGLSLLFGILCVVYWTVPNERVPWRAVWPGALGATLAIGVVDYAFPAYLSSVSTIAEFGTTFVFVLIVLIWFYVLAMVILLGAVVNAYRAHPSGGTTET